MGCTMERENNKIGYLDDNFKIFHIRDKKDITFEYHHHDFSKIVILIDGNVNYFVDVYENGELLTSYQSTDAVTAYPLPVLESNTIQVCGYYGLTVATDVVSNSICHDVIVPFSSQIESDPEWEGIWDYFN